MTFLVYKSLDLEYFVKALLVNQVKVWFGSMSIYKTIKKTKKLSEIRVEQIEGKGVTFK